MKNFMDAYHELLHVSKDDDGEDLGAAMEFQERLAELERLKEDFTAELRGKLERLSEQSGIALPEEKPDDFEWTYPYYQKVWGEIMVAGEQAANAACATIEEGIQAKSRLEAMETLLRVVSQYVTLGNINLNKDFDGSQRLWIDMCGLGEVEVEKEYDHGD